MSNLKSGKVSVGTSDTLVLADDNTRIQIVFTNDGANDIWIKSRNPSKTGQVAVLLEGILVASGGGQVTLGTPMSQGNIRGIAATGATDLAYQTA